MSEINIVFLAICFAVCAYLIDTTNVLLQDIKHMLEKILEEVEE